MSRVVRALFALQHAGLEGRLRITFELFDVDRSGSIDRQELFEILKVPSYRIATTCPGWTIWDAVKSDPALKSMNVF